MTPIRHLGGTRVMIAGCVWLGASLVVASLIADGSWMIVTLPLTALTINLASAIATSPALRRGALGLFHVALLALLVTAAVGRLTHLDARVEIAEATAFDAAAVDVRSRGPWHRDRLHAIAFVQGAYSTEYAKGVKRERTRSELVLFEPDGRADARTVGDDAPLILEGYRFYTTHNKGFAPIITWVPSGADPLTGALHMPSYPMFDWNQQLVWTTPAGEELRISLDLERKLDDRVAWRLDPARTAARLVVHAKGERHRLAPGDAVELRGGVLSSMSGSRAGWATASSTTRRCHGCSCSPWWPRGGLRGTLHAGFRVGAAARL